MKKILFKWLFVLFLVMTGSLSWAGSGDVVLENKAITGTLGFNSGTTIDEFSTDGTFAGNSDNAIPTEKAVKTYGDANWDSLWTDAGAYINPSTTAGSNYIKLYDQPTDYGTGWYALLNVSKSLNTGAIGVDHYGGVSSYVTLTGGAHAAAGGRSSLDITGTDAGGPHAFAGFNTGHSSVLFSDYVGANGTNFFGQWTLAKGPPTSSYSYTLLGHEINVQNSKADEGLKTSLTGNWSTILNLVPESAYNSETGYNVSTSILLHKSTHSPYPQSHIGMWVHENAIANNGYAFYVVGGDSAANKKENTMRMDGHWNYGLNFANATYASTMAIYLGNGQKIHWTADTAIFRNGNDLMFYDANNAGGKTLTQLVSSGALADLSDVSGATQTDKFVLTSDGGNYFGKQLVAADISGLGTGDTPTFAGLNLTGHLDMGDSDYVKLGTSDDLWVGHNGSANVIGNYNGMTLNINNSTDSETMAYFTPNAEVALYYNNSLKLKTTNTGICYYGSAGACDYVFEDDYEFLTLDELQEYITKNQQLPNLTLGDEKSIDVDTMRVQLTEKIEEQALYILQLHQRLKALET